MNGWGSLVRIVDNATTEDDEQLARDVAFVRERLAHIVNLLEHTSNPRDAARYLFAAQVGLRPAFRRLHKARP